jgi:hypothetical protein
MPQIYMIITPRAKDVLADKLSLLGKGLISAVERGFGLEGLDDVALTVPAPVLYTDGEMEVQIEIRYTAGEDEYNRGKPFDPSSKEKEITIREISQTFFHFFSIHELERLTFSVWCKPYYNSAFKASK